MNIQESTAGGRRQKQEARFDLIPYEALKRMALVFAKGEAKYGRFDSDPRKANWKGLDITGEQSPLSHALKHIALYADGWTTDPETGEPEDHLGHALANLAMMSWFVGSRESPHFGRTHPEILAEGYEKTFEGAFRTGSGVPFLNPKERASEPKDIQRDSVGGVPGVLCHGGINSATGMGGIVWCDPCQAHHVDGIGQCDKRAAATAISA